ASFGASSLHPISITTARESAARYKKQCRKFLPHLCCPLHPPFLGGEAHYFSAQKVFVLVFLL
ncbi:MAG: hypothetical protein RSF90_07425, partial [Pygmaiobacter sp.]